MKGYFIFRLWKLKKDMLAANDFFHYDAHAVTTMPYTAAGNTSKVIYVDLWVKRLGLEYVLHEVGHALLEWSRRNGLKVQFYDDKLYRDEEIFCQILGEIPKQFYKKLFKLGLTEWHDFLESRDFRKEA